MMSSTKLCRAAEANSVHKITKLIEKGANPNGINSFNETPLLCAIKNCSDNAVSILLTNKADPNFNCNPSLLLYAVTKRVNLHNWNTLNIFSFDYQRINRIIKLLLQFKANVDKINERGMTPLMLLAKANLWNLFDLRLLKTVNAHDYYNRNALHWAICGGFEKSKNLGLRNCLDTVQSLIDHGASVNAIDCYKRTPLIYATKQKIYSLDIIRLLIQKGADPKFVDIKNNTALIYAARQNAFEAVNLLIKFGAISCLDDYNNCYRSFTVPVLAIVPYPHDPTILSTFIEFYENAFDDNVPIVNKICFKCTKDLLCGDCWDGSCNICFEEYTQNQITKLCCGHVICIKCYKNWKKRSNLCPFCKSTFY